MWQDQDDDYFEYPEREIRRRMEEERAKKFRKTAYRAYDMIVSKGIDAIDFNYREEAILAIKRVWGVMTMDEQYERCHFIKNFLVEDLDQINPQPLFDFKKKINFNPSSEQEI